jgi:hypothetical protein
MSQKRQNSSSLHEQLTAWKEGLCSVKLLFSYDFFSCKEENMHKRSAISLMQLKVVAMKVYLVSCNETATVMIDKGTTVLQNCLDFLKVEPGSCSESCPTSSHDGNQISDIKVEEDPVSVTFPGIKPEHEVSCMSVCPLLGTFHRYPELCIVFLISIYRSVHMKQ